MSKMEELLMLRLMEAAGNGVRLMPKPREAEGMKIQEICGLDANENLTYGILVHGVDWSFQVGGHRQGRPVADLLQKQKLQRSEQSLVVYKQERDQIDRRKLVMKPLAKHCKALQRAGVQ